jgi:8-oxo-dGTP pyrophosphatase MutT (NUDIX family)
MASSRFRSEQYFSESFVESAGAVVFRLSTQEICVLRLRDQNEHVLAKGRRNCGETRQDTALREVKEETGYSCRILSVNLYSRSPPPAEVHSVADQEFLHHDACEPFALQIRHLAEGNVKLIWWYIATVNEEENVEADAQDQNRFEVVFCNYTDAVQRLTFVMDQEMVKKALDIVKKTYGGINSLHEKS